MHVSFYNYRRMNSFLGAPLRNEIEKVLELDSDPELFKYQYEHDKRLARFLGTKYGRGTDCGTAALKFCLDAFSIGKGDEVITVGNTYVGTVLSILDAGAKPVFVDIDSRLLMDNDKIEEAITARTKAIMPVHLYGQMCSMDKIRRISKKHDLKVIEDACQSHLARYKGKLAGYQTDAACYSFYPNKFLGGIGSGGMAATNNWFVDRKLENLRNPTSFDKLMLKSRRTPCFLDWMQHAFIKCKARHYAKWIRRRREIAQIYSESLESSSIELPTIDPKSYHVYKDFVIMSKKRNSLMKGLKKAGIETHIHYNHPLHLKKCFGFGYKKGSLPRTEIAISDILSIPINPFLKDDEVQYTIKILRKLSR